MGDNNVGALTDLATPFLHPGESLLGALTASPKGRNTAVAGGGIAGMIGQSQVGKENRLAAEMGLKLGSPMAVLLTAQRLMTVKVKVSPMGHVTEIKELLSEVPLSAVDSMTAKRLGLGGTLAIAAGGHDPVKLECRVGAARDLVAAFDKAKSA